MLLSRSSLSTVTSLLSLTLLLSNLISCNAQDEGESCNIDGSTGVCTRLQNCQSVYQELLQGKPPRGRCGFSGFDPIVCCPAERKKTTSTTTTTTFTTTSTTTVRTTTRVPLTSNPFVNDGRGAKARAKCEEYARSVYVTEIPPILSADRVPVNRSLCKIKTRKLIVGGKKADPKEFPHMVAIGYPTSDRIIWGCGGTLISERFVLSAAHCTFSSSLGVRASWARLGDLNLERSDDDAKPQNIQIIERIRHPSYRSAVSEYHDIALFKLEREVTFNEWIRPSCLPYSLPDIGTDGKATATGWGRVDWAEDASNDLLKVTIALVSQPQCNRTFLNGEKNSRLNLGIVDEWMICAGELGKDTCQGDSGGPLIILNPDYNCMYSVIGVTSFGKLCGSITPGVYTRVYNYVSWIENIVWPVSNRLRPSNSMSAILDACGNDTGSPSISKAEDNLSNSDGPLIKSCVRQNSCSSVRTSSENVNRTTFVSSHTMSASNEKSTRRRYCLWTLTFILAILGLCNLLLNIIVIAVLRISQGMEVIPDENLVKFYGKTDLDRVCLQSGVCQSYGDESMEIAGVEAGVQIDVNNHLLYDETRAKVVILPNGTTMSKIESFEVKDPKTGTIYFTTDFPNFGLPAGVEKIDVKIAETHRITSPVNESLTVNSDDQISMQGAEGASMESKDIVWSADTDIFLKSINGSIVLNAKDGVSINIENIPVAPMFLQNPSGHEQYKVCICMPQGKLFKVPVRTGVSSRSVNCARISRTPENDPCLR